MSAGIPMADAKSTPAPPYAAVGPAQSGPNERQNESAYAAAQQGHETIHGAPHPNEAQYNATGTAPAHGSSNAPAAPVATVTPLKLLRDQPAYIDCPFCRSRQKTRAEEKDSEKTWLAAILVCLVCPCVACIPFNCCLGWFQDHDHYCGGCGAQVTHRPYEKEVQVLYYGPEETQPSQYATQPQPVYQPDARKA